MRKTEYIDLTVPKGSIFDLPEKDQEKRIENAWKELRAKTLAMGKPFMLGNELEMPDGRVLPLTPELEWRRSSL